MRAPNPRSADPSAGRPSLARTAAWTLALALGLGLPAVAAEQAGVSAAVRGEVMLARAQAPERSVSSGEHIFLQDALESGPDAGMQILLLDETVFTLGPDSEVVVDEYVYDPGTGAGKLAARVTKGVFRFVSGRIAQQDPEDVSIELPSGTIGIRGTVLAGRADPASRSSTVVLLGEGRDNDVGARPAAVEVCNAGSCVDLKRTGFATRIEGPAAEPVRPFRMPQQELAGLVGALTPKPRARASSPGSAAGGSAREVAGALDADTLKAARNVAAEADAADLLANFTANATQDVLDTAAEAQSVQDGLAHVADLLRVQTGTAVYQRAGIPLDDGGSFDANLSLEFGKRILAGEFVNITSPSLGLSGESSAGSESYAGVSPSAPASFQFSDPTVALPPACSPGPCTLNGKVAFFNKNGVVADGAEASLEILGGSQPVSGSGDVPRVQ